VRSLIDDLTRGATERFALNRAAVEEMLAEGNAGKQVRASRIRDADSLCFVIP
jgi:hypothetical protein